MTVEGFGPRASAAEAGTARVTRSRVRDRRRDREAVRGTSVRTIRTRLDEFVLGAPPCEAPVLERSGLVLTRSCSRRTAMQGTVFERSGLVLTRSCSARGARLAPVSAGFSRGSSSELRGRQTRAHHDLEIAIPRAYFADGFEFFTASNGTLTSTPPTIDHQTGCSIRSLGSGALEPGNDKTWIYHARRPSRTPLTASPPAPRAHPQSQGDAPEGRARSHYRSRLARRAAHVNESLSP